MTRPVVFNKPALWLMALGLALLLLASTLSWAATLKVAQPDQRLYPDPDLTSPVLATLPQGAEVLVLRQLGAWYKVDYQGKKGWAEQVTFRFPDLLSPVPVKDGKGEDAVIGGMAKQKSIDNGMMASRQPPSAGIMAERAEKAPPLAAVMAPKPAAPPGKPAPLAQKFLRVQKADQFLYPDPDATSSPLGPVPVKARVKMLKQEDDWYKVEHQGKQGWLPIQALGR